MRPDVIQSRFFNTTKSKYCKYYKGNPNIKYYKLNSKAKQSTQLPITKPSNHVHLKIGIWDLVVFLGSIGIWDLGFKNQKKSKCDYVPLKTSGSIEKWINLEYRKLNQNVVARQLFISDLLQMDRPVAETREGKEYVFNKTALEEFAQMLPKEYHRKLRLPILFYSSIQVSDSCYLCNEIDVEVLKITNDISEMYRFREGKLWISKPIAFEIANKYPTLVQFVMH